MAEDCLKTPPFCGHRDIALVTSGDKLRVVAVTSSSGAQNVRDLMYLRSIDLVLTNVRYLNGFVKSGELGRDLQLEAAGAFTTCGRRDQPARRAG